MRWTSSTTGVLEDHRKCIQQFEELDLVTQDMLIAQSEQLEMFHWFVRAHLEDSSGQLADAGESTERGAAQAAGQS